jgi:hypothetical protein
LAQDEISKRDKTLAIGKIDEAYIAKLAINGWASANNQRANYLDRHEQFEASWRDLTSAPNSGPWENSANFKSKLILKYGKATHARLWQLFSSPSGFYRAEARQEPFRDREEKVKQFMDFVLESYCNSKTGAKDEWDKWLWDVVFKGSGYLKCYWKHEEHEYLEVVPTMEVVEKIVFDSETLTGNPVTETKLIEKEEVKTDILETPQIKRIVWEDVAMPIGETDPQKAAWVSNRVYMSDEDLKSYVKMGKFNRQAVEEAIQVKENRFSQHDEASSLKTNRLEMDGNDLFSDSFENGFHVVHEWYGKAFIKPEVDELNDSIDLDEVQKEIVAWVHQGTQAVLGWTYLHRISPGGIRPIFKGDFVSFPDRTNGVGVPELVYEEQRYQESVTNMRMDNGTLASLPMFVYRQTSGLKPQHLRVKPGQGIPVDDVNDMRVFQFPFLQGFGYQEEQSIEGKAEGLLAISDIQLGRAPDKVGALRNATGSNLLAQEAGIQLEIHFDRIARCVNRVLQFLFRLCRERMPHEIYYRVTGERGEPIFGKVNRDDLKGEFDFKISVDILGQSQLEKQQQAVLLMQTLINPAYMQTGIVAPENIYNLAKNFLKVHKLGRVDDYLTKPQGYVERVTPTERLYRLAFGLYTNPPIAQTVALDEDHQKALETYEQFQNSDLFGLLTQDALMALEQLKQKHMQMLQAQQAGGNPALTGMQIPRDGYQGLSPGAQGQSQMAALQGAGGAPNGPVV